MGPIKGDILFICLIFDPNFYALIGITPMAEEEKKKEKYIGNCICSELQIHIRY